MPGGLDRRWPTHVRAAYDPAHYAEAMAGKRWFGDAAGLEAAGLTGLLDSIGGSLEVAGPVNRLAANLGLGLGMASSVPP